MAKLRVHAYSVSLDGFGAGPRQSLEAPLGVGGQTLHTWAFGTRTLQQMVFGREGGATGVDDDFIIRGFAGIGSWILGRNMFGPVRGAWPDETWKGWWGANPPYHCPVYVLTHHARPSITMEGGTIFHFVTGGIREALARATESAGDKDIRVGGGAATIRQYLQERLVDEMHLAYSPVFLGSGESLFAGLNVLELGYECADHVTTAQATHVILKKRT